MKIALLLFSIIISSAITTRAAASECSMIDFACSNEDIAKNIGRIEKIYKQSLTKSQSDLTLLKSKFKTQEGSIDLSGLEAQLSNTNLAVTQSRDELRNYLDNMKTSNLYTELRANLAMNFHLDVLLDSLETIDSVSTQINKTKLKLETTAFKF